LCIFYLADSQRSPKIHKFHRLLVNLPDKGEAASLFFFDDKEFFFLNYEFDEPPRSRAPGY
jgi:hypothetical protein